MFDFGAWRRRLFLGACAPIMVAFISPAHAGPVAANASIPCGSSERLFFSDAAGLGGQQHLSTLIFPATLSEYYEHGREHAPPRSPDGGMQRRELFYRAPPDPFDAIESALGVSTADRQFAIDLALLQKRWMSGDLPESSAIAQIRTDAEHSGASGICLLNAARGFQWMVDERLAAALFAVGLKKSWREIQVNAPTTDSAQSLLHLLDQTRILWNSSDTEARMLRFRIARQLNPPLSIESRRAGFHLAEALVADKREAEAAELILRVNREHQEAKDLGKRDTSDIAEMALVTGITLFAAERYQEAVPYLAMIQGDKASHAETYLFEALLRSGQKEQAKKLLDNSIASGKFTPGPQTFESRLAEETTREQWQKEQGFLPQAANTK